MNISRMDRYKKVERIKQQKLKKKLGMLTAGIGIVIGGFNVSFAQLNIDEKVEQFYSQNKQQVFSTLDQYLGQELALQEMILHSETKSSVSKMGDNLLSFTENEIIPELQQNLQNYYNELVLQIKNSKEQEKELFLMELEASLEIAREEAALFRNGTIGTVPVPLPGGAAQPPVQPPSDGTPPGETGQPPSEGIPPGETGQPPSEGKPPGETGQPPGETTSPEENGQPPSEATPPVENEQPPSDLPVESGEDEQPTDEAPISSEEALESNPISNDPIPPEVDSSTSNQDIVPSENHVPINSEIL